MIVSKVQYNTICNYDNDDDNYIMMMMMEMFTYSVSYEYCHV
jgi:hypothetical protein